MARLKHPLVVSVQFDRKDVEQFDILKEKLALDRSEIIRRAAREGLKTFKGVTLPGSTQEAGNDE